MSRIAIVIIDNQGEEERVELPYVSSQRLKKWICQGNDPASDALYILGCPVADRPADHHAIQSAARALRGSFY